MIKYFTLIFLNKMNIFCNRHTLFIKDRGEKALLRLPVRKNKVKLTPQSREEKRVRCVTYFSICERRKIERENF